MKKHDRCPICGGSAIQKIAERYNQVIEPPPNIQQGGINAILNFVLACKSLTTETMLCLECRHIYLSPTFEDAELDRFYSADCLAATKLQYRMSERSTGLSWAEQHGIRTGDQKALLSTARKYRPKRLHELIKIAAGHDHFGKVLDFGANTGELTEYFSNSRRYVFDKDLSRVIDKNVISLGSMRDISLNGPYDLIVLSHVLEHIPYPPVLLKQLRMNLVPDGLVYSEVPLEYCGTIIKRRGIPIGGHINYFSRSSLLHCLQSAGFKSIAMIRREIAPYGECQGPVIKSVASANYSRRFGSKRYQWQLDLLIDTILILKARFIKKRFG